MRLVDEIIEGAADGKKPLADVLRKCLVLSFELKNEKLKAWVESELNGYRRDDALPEYRQAHLHSTRNLAGPMGAWRPNVPLPAFNLDKKHREILEESNQFRGPIAIYDVRGAKEGGHHVINWPPELIVLYQSKFMEGFALSQAWQEVPDAILERIVETVRNRVLRFALEIREELGEAHDKPSEVPPQKVEAAVVNYILGGTNIIAGTATNFNQIGNLVVAKGDFNGLSEAFRKLDMPEKEIAALDDAIVSDERTFGVRTKAWLADISGKVGKAGLNVGAAVVEELAKRWLMQYFNLGS